MHRYDMEFVTKFEVRDTKETQAICPVASLKWVFRKSHSKGRSWRNEGKGVGVRNEFGMMYTRTSTPVL
jgi:hypothetical protein